jgi:hypothetical protein
LEAETGEWNGQEEKKTIYCCWCLNW